MTTEVVRLEFGKVDVVIGELPLGMLVSLLTYWVKPGSGLEISPGVEGHW